MGEKCHCPVVDIGGHAEPGFPAGAGNGGLPRKAGDMRVQVQDQVEDAKVVTDEDGTIVLCLRPGVVSSRAFVALVLALAPVLEQGRQYLQCAG